MNSNEKPKLAELIVALGDHYPDWRTGQLLLNLAGWADVDLWDASDDDLIAAAEAHLQQIAGESANSSPAAAPHRTTAPAAAP